MVEQFHRELKTALSSATPYGWVNHLPFTLLNIWVAMKQDLGYRAADLVYSMTLTLPADLVIEP